MATNTISGTVSGVTSGATFNAYANSPYDVILYDEHGNDFLVRSDSVENLLSFGFRKNKLDIQVTLSEFLAFIDAAKLAVVAFVDGVVRDGFIDTSDEKELANSVYAMKKLGETYNQLNVDVSKLYKVRGEDE